MGAKLPWEGVHLYWDIKGDKCPLGSNHVCGARGWGGRTSATPNMRQKYTPNLRPELKNRSSDVHPLCITQTRTTLDAEAGQPREAGNGAGCYRVLRHLRLAINFLCL